ncbi:lysophospholipid acyltransferase family protein [Thermodesulfobacteriota bacterium]
MIRFIGLNAFISIHTIVFSIWAIIVSIFDSTGRKVHFYAAVPWARILLRVCGINVRVKGRQNADGHVPRIYMSNHQSYFDIFVLLAHLPVDFKFVLKKELTKIPIFGFSLRRARYISIDRGDPRKAVKSLNAAADRIKNGASVLIFPEGTRSEDGLLLPFKPGGFHLALKSGCEIVPIAIINSREIVPKGSLRIRKGSVAMNIGNPIPIKGYNRKNMDLLMNLAREAMANQLNENP